MPMAAGHHGVAPLGAANDRLGLLEAIPAADILARAWSTRRMLMVMGWPSIVPSPEIGGPAIGRFGFKGRAATVRY